MPDAPPQPNPIAALNTLLDFELASVFHFFGDNLPFFDPASAPLRQPVLAMIAASRRRERELSDMIDRLGGDAIARGLQSEEQNIAYLSIRYLLPRLLQAKRIAIARWHAALEQLGLESPAAALLQRQLAELETELAALSGSATLPLAPH
jgi:hypothetical protein